MKSNELANEIRSIVEESVNADKEASKYAKYAIITANELLEGCEFERIEETDYPTFKFISQYANFAKWDDDGATTDLLYSHIMEGFKKVKVTSLKREIYDKLTAILYEDALFPIIAIEQIEDIVPLIVD